MAVRTIAAATANQLLQRPLHYNTSLSLVNRVSPMALSSLSRHLTTIKLTNNLLLLTGDNRSVKVVNLKVSDSQNRPLVVILSWLMAKPKHIHKFANYYIDKGFDVLNVNTSPWQLLWPAKGTQVIADELIKFFYVNENYEPIILHGFSVGAYQWGEVLLKLQENQEQYKNVINRISGHIWDSAVDYQQLDQGVPIIIFPKSVLLQHILRRYMKIHLKIFEKIATRHYIKSSQFFHGHFIKAPALFLLSKNDPVGPIVSNSIVKEKWEKSGIEVQWKCWDNSPHVGHYYFHGKEYIEQLNIFLKRIGIQKTEPDK